LAHLNLAIHAETAQAERDTLTQAGYTWKFKADRPDDTPVKAISIKFVLVVANAPAVSLT
jgi:hypothetical protein